MWLLGFLSCAAVWPGIAGLSTTPKWAVIALLVPFLLWDKFRPSLLLLLFLTYASVSLFWAPPYAWGSLYQWVLFGGLVAIGAVHDLKRFYVGAAWGLSISSVLCIADWFGYNVHYEWGFGAWVQPYSGTFYSPNFLCEPAVLIVVGLIAHGYWRTALLPMPAIMLAHSRGALLAGAVALGLMLWDQNKWLAAGLFGCVLAGSVALQAAGYRIESNADRLRLYQDTVLALTVRGHGVGSFHNEFPKYASTFRVDSRPDQAHNDVLQLLFEFGVGALPFLLLLLVAWFGESNPERMVLAALLTESLYAFPLFLPTTFVVGALVIGHLVANRDWLYVSDFLRRMAVLAGRARVQRTSARRKRNFGLHGSGW